MHPYEHYGSEFLYRAVLYLVHCSPAAVSDMSSAAAALVARGGTKIYGMDLFLMKIPGHKKHLSSAPSSENAVHSPFAIPIWRRNPGTVVLPSRMPLGLR